MTRVKRKKTDHIFYHFCLVKFFSQQFYTTPYTCCCFFFPWQYTHRCSPPPCLRVVTFVNFLFLVVVVVSLLFLHPHPTAAVRGFLSDPKKSDDERLSLQLEGVKFPFLIPSFQMTTTDTSSCGLVVLLVCVFLILDTSPNGP